MKTRLLHNTKKNLYYLQVINNGEYEEHTFTNLNEALKFQKFTINLNKYKDFI
jgi:hypothetical protein